MGFIIGVAIASFKGAGLPLAGVSCFSVFAFLAVIAVFSSKRRGAALFLFFSAFVFFGIWRYQLGLPGAGSGHIQYYNGKDVILSGQVAEEVKRSGDSQKVVLRAGSLKIPASREIKVKGKVQVFASPYPEIDYADKMRLACSLREPEPFAGFAYDRYLARYDIYSLCFYPEVRAKDAGQGSRAYGFILMVKERVRQALESGMEEPASTLAKAMVLGDKQAIQEKEREMFARAGISHIIAISGMHIGILFAIVMFFLLGVGLKRRQAFYVATIFLVLYVILIGFPASAVRASIIGFLLLLAFQFGRLHKLGYSLVLAATVMLVVNPALLRDDIGFQLSFLAVLGIAWLYGPLNRCLKYIRVPAVWGIRGVLAVTLSAQIFTVPLAVYHFGVFSLVAPLTNLLVMWALPFFLGSALAGVVFAWAVPQLSVLWFLPAWLVLEYVRMIAHFLSGLPGVSLGVFPQGEWVAAYYAILSALFMLCKTKIPAAIKPKRRVL